MKAGKIRVYTGASGFSRGPSGTTLAFKHEGMSELDQAPEKDIDRKLGSLV